MVGTLIISAAALFGAHDAKASIDKELAKYYQTSKMPPSWEKSMRQLGAKDADARRGAVKHLAELMEHSWKDEKSGKAPWLNTPYWGGEMENPARNLRGAIVSALAETPATPELLPIVQWLLRHEPQMRLQETMAGYLGKIAGKDADDFRLTLVMQPHANAIVMGIVLAQMQEHKIALPANHLKELCHHHRKFIRDGARKLNQTLKGADPGPFDPVQALKTPAVRKTLGDLQALMIELPDKNTPFVEVTTRYLQKDEVKRTVKDQGWLIKQDKDVVTLYSPHGARAVHRDKEATKITMSKRIEHGAQYWDIDVVASISVAKVPIDDYVKEIVAIRAKGNEDFELSPRGGLTGQFQGRGASLVEAILIAWLDRADKPAQAAALLLPALDTLYEDRHFVEMARHRLGDALGQRMLVAFIGDRDYPETLRLAQALAKHYPDTQFHEYAAGLAEQLPRRMDDFKTFKLPGPKEWAEMKKKMSRREQIDFLCQRMRLLNCFQMGQPGGYSPSSTQYAEPCGLSANAAWGLNKGKTEVINPVNELVGDRYGWRLADDKKVDKGLDLKVTDIPALVPYLRDDWYMLIVSFWRDFHPNRNLSRSRQYFAGWINELAQHDLCELATFEKLPAADREAHLKKIVAWAEVNKNKTEEELLVEAVRAAMDKKTHWRNVSDRMATLVKLKSPKAIAILEHYLAQPDEDGYYLPDLLDHLKTLDRKKADEWAQKFLDHKRGRLRMQCAMMVFEAGDAERAVPILATLLKEGSAYEISRFTEQAIDALLKLDTAPAKKAARGILGNKAMRGPRTEFDGDLPFSRFGDDGLNRAPIILRLEKAGYPEGYAVYLELLDAKGKDFGNATYGAPVAKLAVNEILSSFGEKDAELQKIRKIEDFEERRVAVRRWVEAKTKGKK